MFYTYAGSMTSRGFFHSFPVTWKYCRLSCFNQSLRLKLKLFCLYQTSVLLNT